MERDLSDAYAYDMYREELEDWRRERESFLEDLVNLTEDNADAPV